MRKGLELKLSGLIELIRDTMNVRMGLRIDVATCRRNRNKQRDRRRDKWRKHKNHSEEEDPDKEEGGLSAPFNFEQPGIYCTRTFPI